MKHFIESRPEVMRGAVVIKGTRIPMEMVLNLLAQGHTIEEVHKRYSWVSIKTLKGAIAELAATIDHPNDGSSLLQA